MVFNFDFVDGSLLWIGSSCRIGIKCVEICCVCCWIFYFNIEYVLRGFDGVIVFESLFNFCFVLCFSMRFQIQSVVLVIVGFCCLIYYCSEIIWIFFVFYFVDNVVGYCYLFFLWFFFCFIKDNFIDSLNIIFRVIKKI